MSGRKSHEDGAQQDEALQGAAILANLQLEQKYEETITAFLQQRYGFERIPVPTEALTLLIERDAGDLDAAMNLSDETYEVFGFTQFERGRKPFVKIARELWEQRHRNNRLRTTLTHEYGHYADSRIMPRNFVWTF